MKEKEKEKEMIKEKEKERNNKIVDDISNNTDSKSSNDNIYNNFENGGNLNENHGSTGNFPTVDTADDQLYTPGNSPLRAKKGPSTLTVRCDFYFYYFF